MRFAVVGDPVIHSLSPRMHTAAYRALGLDHSYEAVRLPLNEAVDWSTRLTGYRGVNVTVPLKEFFASQVEVDDFTRRAGAVNTIDLETGRAINTDGPGFIDVIQPYGFSRVLVLGAGGSARSLVLALAIAGYDTTIWNRNQIRAEQLASALGVDAQVSSGLDVAGFDLIVNATSASLVGLDLPIDWQRAEQDAVAFDLYYSDRPTLFHEGAARRGLRTIDGRELLVAQGARCFEWWLGIPAPRDVMRNAVYDDRDSS